MRNSPFWWILIGFMVLLDIYVFQAVKTLAWPAATRTRTIIFIGYWTISVVALLLLIFLPYLHFDQQSRMLRSTIFALIAGLFFAKFIAALFFFIDDVRRGVQWMTGLWGARGGQGDVVQQPGITRSAFLTWTGMLFGGGLFGSLIYGFGNRYKYQVKTIPVTFNNLPEAFRGLRIVHISDIHSGSFTDKQAVKKGVEKIMREKPDLIFFTGDLVNNTADEMDEYQEIFAQLSAPMGVYSTLGNHDYGDYVQWDTPEAKIANLDRLKQVHASMGWKLLMNEHVVLEKDGEKIAILGIENWSAKGRFPKYGKMQDAHAGTEAYPFKILLSHDPSHWDGEVKEKYPDIDLMLSGHTHGMQFGVELPGFKWSPVQYMYHQWAGLYETGSQKLYVNRGYGFLGYPGRVGILPEITVLHLA